MSGYLFQIELPIQDNWRTIEVLRTTVLNCLTTMFSPQDYCETVGMIVAELLENAHKYGRWELRPKLPGAFRLRVCGTDERIEIVVCNPVDPTHPNLGRLFELVGRLEKGSPEEVYLDRLRTVAVDPQSVGGLGLARIAYEANCRLSAELDGDDVLQVRAVATLAQTPGASAAPLASD